VEFVRQHWNDPTYSDVTVVIKARSGGGNSNDSGASASASAAASGGDDGGKPKGDGSSGPSVRSPLVELQRVPCLRFYLAKASLAFRQA